MANGLSRDGELYLDLLKRMLTRYGFDRAIEPIAVGPSKPGRALRAIQAVLNRRGFEVYRRVAVDLDAREEGRDWPLDAETMVGLRRLENLEHCIGSVIADGVPGDLVETGAWRGGSTIFMRGALEAFGDSDRAVWVADSFEGLPPPDAERYPADAGDEHYRYSELRVSLEAVKANFAKYGLLDDRVRFLTGWFRDTLPTAPIEQLAILRLDGDLYESTTDALEALYPKVSVGGYVIVDDYGYVDACRQATEDYRARNGITDEVVAIDWTGVYWRRRS